MSVFVNWLFGKSVHPEVVKYQERLSNMIGEGHVYRVRIAEKEVNRFAIFGTAYDDKSQYTNLFKKLAPEHIWLQDRPLRCNEDCLKGRIMAKGGHHEVDFSLMWAEVPGKIYCAYPDGEDQFVLERFFPAEHNQSGITETVSAEGLQKHIVHHFELKHDKTLWREGVEVLNDHVKNPAFTSLINTNKCMHKIKNTIKSNKDLLSSLRGKKHRKKRQKVFLYISKQKQLLEKKQKECCIAFDQLV